MYQLNLPLVSLLSMCELPLATKKEEVSTLPVD